MATQRRLVHRLSLLALGAALLAAACTGSAEEEAEGQTATSALSTDRQTGPEPANETETGGAIDGVEACPSLSATATSTIAAPDLNEASGLAVSANHPGVIWTHNDGGRAPSVVALDLDGNELGEFPLPDVEGVDVEDLALVDGVLYLADIGDNGSDREGVAVYRFAEPDPRGGGRIGAVETIDLAYPDGAIDAESLLVDPLSGQLLIIAKKVRFGDGALLSADAAPIFVADPPFDLGGTTTLAQQGVVPLDVLRNYATGAVPEGTISDLGVGDVATGADIRADGTTIAVRTYRSVWLFDRDPSRSMAEALATTPCAAPTVLEPQGEAVAFLDATTDAFVTVSEGENPTINITR